VHFSRGGRAVAPAPPAAPPDGRLSVGSAAARIGRGGSMRGSVAGARRDSPATNSSTCGNREYQARQ
jgi:hypothetical protein